MAFCNPLQRILGCKVVRLLSGRVLAFLLGFLGALFPLVTPASAQAISLLQDTETERLLQSYETPILRVAGLEKQNIQAVEQGKRDMRRLRKGGVAAYPILRFAATVESISCTTSH